MNESMNTIKAQLDMHTRWLNNVLAGITEEESLMRSSEHMNHMKWVAGHLLNTRVTSMSKIAGLQMDESYKVLFARGSALAANDAYPSLESIMEKWNSIGVVLSEAMLHVPAEILAARSPGQLPIADATIHGTLAFLLSHEAFHIGQLSVMRKMLGRQAMNY